jgi:predicted O-methyltransferase YrrM
MNEPRERALVISMMKNEGPYILEWLAWQRVVGFTDILVYSNDCEDGTDLMLDRLQALGELVHVRNKVLKRGPQKSALKYAMAHPHYREAHWVFVCDIDEFLTIREGDGRLHDLVARFPGADAIPVAWRMFSSAGETALPRGLTVTTFTDAEPEVRPDARTGRFVKTLFRRSDRVVRLGTHAPVYDDDATPVWASAALEADPSGDPERPAPALGYGPAQVNHYAVRSVDAYLVKRDRGRVNHVDHDMGLDYWQRWNIGGAEDRTILRHLPDLEAEIARLRDDPVTEHLERGMVDWHRRKVAELAARPDYAALRAALVGTRPAPAAPTDPKTAPKTGPAHDAPPGAADLSLRAPKRHQNRLRMLAEMPKGARCAEIGVWDGAFSAAILEVTRPSELVLIDPWDLLAARDSSEWTHARHREAEAMAGMRANVEARYGGLPNVSIRQGFSAEVLGEYPDGHFDWVYIDGNHLYDFVRQDLELARHKVRKGGTIAGDDFFWKRDGRMHVRDAVLDALRDWGGRARPARIGQQYMIRVE